MLSRRAYRPFDGDVRILEAVYDGAAMSLNGVVVSVHNSQQSVQSNIPDVSIIHIQLNTLYGHSNTPQLQSTTVSSAQSGQSVFIHACTCRFTE